MLLGADRELDSSITIKRIVFHLFHFNLSHNKEMIQAPNCSNQRDEDMKLSHTRHETRERHQASKQRATRSNKNQSMKEQRTAPPSPSWPATFWDWKVLDCNIRDLKAMDWTGTGQASRAVSEALALASRSRVEDRGCCMPSLSRSRHTLARSLRSPPLNRSLSSTSRYLSRRLIGSLIRWWIGCF